ncbi:MAG: isochorismatase family protein [Pirellulaceae bacterium]
MPQAFCVANQERIDTILDRLSRQIHAKLPADFSIVGIRRRGAPLAQQLAGRVEKLTGHRPSETEVTVKRYADDLTLLHKEPRLDQSESTVSKGIQPDRDSYSAYEESGLAEQLRRESVKRLWIGGVALDVCVRATALDGLREGFEVHLIRDGASPVDEAAGRRATDEMEQAGVIVETENVA